SCICTREKRQDTNSRVLLENGDLRLVPGSCARPPAPYVPAILFVIRAELLANVGSSYNRTNRCTPRATAATAAITLGFACPKTTHSPIQPTAKPTYIGLRTYR